MQLQFTSFQTPGPSHVEELATERSTGDVRFDRSTALALRATAPVVDGASLSIAVKVTIVNLSQVSYRGPFSLLLVRQGSILKGIRATNSSNGESGSGAEWTVPVEGSELKPGQESSPITLRWSFSELPDQFDDYPAEMAFRILSGPISR